MSLRSPVNNLEVTGNILELPCRETTTKSLDRKTSIPQIKSAVKRQTAPIKISRSISTGRLIPPESAKIHKKNDLKSPSEMFVTREHQIKSYDIYLVIHYFYYKNFQNYSNAIFLNRMKLSHLKNVSKIWKVNLKRVKNKIAIKISWLMI